MSFTEPTLAEPVSADEFQRQAAERVTPFAQYAGAKLMGGLEATRPVEALELGILPSRWAPDEYGLMPPGPPPADLLTKEQFDASVHKRPGLEWEPGETEARAAARAAVHDRQAYRDSLVARSDTGWLGQTVGVGIGVGTGALDFTNYIPLIGPASKALMVARFGRIGGSLLMHGSEAALNTGLFEPLAVETARVQGRDYGWEEAGADILTNALGGAVLGTAVGEAARALGFGHGAAPGAPRLTPEAEPLPTIAEPIAPPIVGVPEAGAGVVPRRPGQPPLRVDDMMRRTDAANLALDQVDRGEPVDVGKLLANDPAVRPHELPPGIDAYHGTPHLFDEFSAEKIGTGEGAQAYGHGLYFAEHRGTAEGYQRSLSGGRTLFDGRPLGEVPQEAIASLDPAERRAFGYVQDSSGKIDEALLNLAEEGKFEPKAAAAHDALKSMVAAGRLKPNDNTGALYKVRLRMEHGDLLDWDKPLSEQSPKVREALHALVPTEPKLKQIIDADLRGGEFYRAMKNTLWTPETAAGDLRGLGIHGISYLDAGSRDAAEGSRNIVVFDPARVHVVERNGMSLATAPPEPPHPSVAEAAARVGKGTPELETFAKDAKLEGYDKPLPGHEPKPEPVPGEPAKPAKPERPPTPAEKAAATAALPPELGEVEAMRREGSLTPADEATLAAGEKEAQKAEGYADAWTSLVNCVLRNAV